MPADARGGELPIEVVLRMLGEYSSKVASGLERRSRVLLGLAIGSLGWVLSALTPLVPGLATWPAPSPELDTTRWLAAMLSLMMGGITVFCFFVWYRERSPLQLAAWQLRKIYEVASRLEDVGAEVDIAHSLEFELRLSEAQFLLNRAFRAKIEQVPTSVEVGNAMRQRRVGDYKNAIETLGPSPDAPGRSASEPA